MAPRPSSLTILYRPMRSIQSSDNTKRREAAGTASRTVRRRTQWPAGWFTQGDNWSNAHYGCIALLCLLSHAPTSGRLKFEVASLKSSRPPSGYPARRISGGPGTTSPGQISYFQQSLQDLVFMAYRVQFFQLHTPDWMECTYFDVTAKLPAGATKDDVAMMLQDLLAERLKVRIRRDTRDIPGYLLPVGQNGPKLRSSADLRSPSGPPPATGKGPRFLVDKDGFIIAPSGITNLPAFP